MMNEDTLLTIVRAAESNAIDGEMAARVKKNNDYYNGEPFGDEEPNRSSVVSMDVQDTIESDQPSLVRTFLGPHDVMEFEASTVSEADQKEAEQKTTYVNYVINNAENSFETQHGWIKDGLLSFGVVTFGYVKTKKVRELEYEGLSDIEIQVLLDDLNNDKNLKSVDVIRDKGKDSIVKFKITQEIKKYELKGVPPENFKITKGSATVEDAELVGHDEELTRGQLVEMGYKRKLVESLVSDQMDNQGVTEDRFQAQGGSTPNATSAENWANEELTVSFLYQNVDFDDDGIAERRRIVKVGDKIIDNDPYEMAPYAVLSSILMPHTAIGKSRADLAVPIQRIKSVLQRYGLNNVYAVGQGRVVVNDSRTNMDDLLTGTESGVVRTKGEPIGAVVQLDIPYIGNEILQMMQYVDSTRSQSLGNQTANQGLESDKLYKETATRFEGVQEAGAAKIELVARVYAETGYTRLFEIAAWTIAHFQREAVEIKVLGQPVQIDPRGWRHDHKITSHVGLASDDTDTVINNFSSILTVQEQLKARGSVIVDDKKIYNTLSKLFKTMGVRKISDLANDPEVPQEVLQAKMEELIPQNEFLMDQVEELSSRNQLAEAEAVKARASLIEAQTKAEQKNTDQSIDMQKHTDKMTLEYDKLERQEDVDIPGKGTE